MRAKLCGCDKEVRDRLAEMGVEAHVTSEPPVIPSPYEDLGMRCPHGVRWYAEPTSEQIAKWADEGVE